MVGDVSLNDRWSKGSRRTGGTPADIPFAPRSWPLKPRAKVPQQDPTDPQDDANPANDKSASGGETSGTHGRGRGRHGCDTGMPSDDITTDPRRVNEHHCDDESEPHESARRDVDRRPVRGIRSRSRRRVGRSREELAAEDEEPVRPAPTARVHTAAGVHMDKLFTSENDGSSAPRFPGTTPLRYITPAKRSRAGLGASRSRRLPGPQPVTSPLPFPGCQNQR